MPSYGTPTTLSIEPLDVIIQRHQDLIAQIERLIVVPDEKIRKELVHVLIHHEFAPVRLLARMVGPLPASEENHDEGPYGLYRHSLLVVISALTKFHGRTPKPDEPTGKKAKRHYRELVATFIAALTHDLGKILFLTIEVAGCPNPVRPWDPARGYLLDYVAHCKGTGISIVWMWGRTRTGFRGHEPLGAWYHTHITPPTLLKYLGAEQANNIIAVFARTLGPPISGIADLVKEADIECSIHALRLRQPNSEDLASSTAPLPVPMPLRTLAPIIDLPPIGKGSRIEDFLAQFRQMTGSFSINGFNADLYVSVTHTIIPIGTPVRTNRVKGGGQGSVLRRVAESVRNKLHMDPHADPNVKQFYMTSEGNKYLGFLAEMSQGQAYWCVPGERPVNGVPVEIRHFLTIERDRTAAAFHETPCIIIRNEVLWGNIDAAALYGVFSEPILLTDPHKIAESVDPESLGFRALEKPSMRSPTPPPHEERTVAASALAYRSWIALNHLAPYAHLPPAVLAHWNAIGTKLQAPGSMTDNNLLLDSLEAIAERLDDLVAHKTSAGALSPNTMPSPHSPGRPDAPASDLVTVAPPVSAESPSLSSSPLPRRAVTSSPPRPSPIPESPPSPARTASIASVIAARLIAAAQSDPIEPPTGDLPHPNSHIIIVQDIACLAWPAVPLALMPELTEMDLVPLLPAIAAKLNAEGGDGHWLHEKSFGSVRYPEPRMQASYLVFNRSLMSFFADQESIPDTIATYYAEEVPV